MRSSTTLVQKLSYYCNIHRADVLSFWEDGKHQSVLIFLKMPDVHFKSPYASQETLRDAATIFAEALS